jgi:hypothetical protein
MSTISSLLVTLTDLVLMLLLEYVLLNTCLWWDSPRNPGALNPSPNAAWASFLPAALTVKLLCALVPLMVVPVVGFRGEFGALYGNEPVDAPALLGNCVTGEEGEASSGGEDVRSTSELLSMTLGECGDAGA